MSIDRDKAKLAAEKYISRNIGNLPHLGFQDFKKSKSVYIFKIKIRYPVVNDKNDGVNFLEPRQIGELKVNSETGEIKKVTDIKKIESRIKEIKEDHNL